MKLSTKIATGYGLVIIIALILGGMAVYNMNRVKTDSQHLSNLYVPGVELEYNLEAKFRGLTYTARAYNYTGSESFYTQLQEEYKAANEILDKAEKHANLHESLSGMKEQIPRVKENIKKYGDYIVAFHKIYENTHQTQKELTLSAEAFMANASAYLENQEKSMNENFITETKRANQAKKILSSGLLIRVMNFKYQTTPNDKNLTELNNAIETCLGEVNKYHKSVSDEARIEKAANLLQVVNSYTGTVKAISSELQKGIAANKENLKRIRTQMDTIAVDFTKLTNAIYDLESSSITKGITERTWKIKMANSIVDNCNKIIAKTLEAQATRNPKLIESGIADFAKIDSILNELIASTKNPVNLKELNGIKSNSVKYLNAMSAYLACEKDRAALALKRAEAANETLTTVNQLTLGGFKRTQNISTSAASLLSSSSLTMIIGLIIAIIVSILLAIFITIGITKSINFVIDGLRRGSEQVTSASEQVSSSSQSLSQGASEQAASLEEISSSLEEMASMTRQNADNAKQANGMSSAASEAAKKGAEAMTKMGEAIEKIKGSSDETAKIIKTIDEIAFQTNLLALNAAVEAARAGEAGKGFAVVAEEVRNLAQRSAEAAKNTSYLIEESQSNAENGVNVSKEVDEILSKIVESSVKVAELINEVTAASNEQSEGVSQISKAVTQLDTVTQSNSANAEESASASEELSAQAIELTDMVNQLVKLVEGNNATTTVVNTARNNSYNKYDFKAKGKSMPKLGSPKDKHDYEKVIPLDSEDFADF